LRLLLDEMYPAVIADGLRRLGVDAVAVQETPAPRGLSDTDLFVAAQLDARYLVTENVADLVAVEAHWRAAHGAPHAGLILVSPRSFPRPRAETIGRFVRALQALAESDHLEPGTTCWLVPVGP
jgi:predicted nuclease of predicted toxin-antitoxin system